MLGHGAVLLAILSLTVQDDEKKKQEEEVQAKIEQFKQAHAKAKSDSERITAFGLLSGVRHPRVVEEVRKHLTQGADDERAAAAGVLGEQNGSVEAGEALLKSVKQQKNAFLKQSIIGAYGGTAAYQCGKLLVPFVDDAHDGVALAAIDAAAKVRSADLIDPLIDLLNKLELTPLPEGPSAMGGSSDAVTEDPKIVRKQTLEEPCRQALASITGQTALKTSDEFKKWWKQNKKTFEVKRGG